jgi:predicted DNA-binding protein
MRQVTVRLEDEQAARLARLARLEGRSRSAIVRDAIHAYKPLTLGDRDFALGRCYSRIDGDPRSISEIPEDELLKGFGR